MDERHCGSISVGQRTESVISAPRNQLHLTRLKCASTQSWRLLRRGRFLFAGQCNRATSEKLYKALDEFGYLPFSFIAFGYVRRQPLLTSRKQPVKSFADCRIRIKLAGRHAESSVVSIRSRLVIAANSVAQALGERDRESRPGRRPYRKSVGIAEPPNLSADGCKTTKQSDGCRNEFDIFWQWLICNTRSNLISRH